jgi:hypothetical protein
MMKLLFLNSLMNTIKSKFNIFTFCILFAFVLISLNSCNVEENKVIKTDKDTTKTAPVQNTGTIKNAQFDSNPKKYGFDEKQKKVATKKGVRIAPEAISKFLPTKLDGYRSYPPSIGSMTDRNNEKTVASKMFSTSGGGSISVEIVDFGVLNTTNKNFLPKMTGYESERLVYPNAYGYIVWIPNNSNIKVVAFFYDRFILTIESNDTKDETKESLKKIIPLVDMAGLKRFADGL